MFLFCLCLCFHVVFDFSVVIDVSLDYVFDYLLYALIAGNVEKDRDEKDGSQYVQNVRGKQNCNVTTKVENSGAQRYCVTAVTSASIALFSGATDTTATWPERVVCMPRA